MTASAPVTAPAREPAAFWRMDEMTFRDPPPSGPEARRPHREGLTRRDLHDPDRSLFAPPPRAAPLAPWSRLWPALRSALACEVGGRDPDVAALLRAWTRGEHVRRIPRVARSVWARRVSVWIDRSPRLGPFWLDQDDVWRRLRAVCGRNALTTRVLDGRRQACLTAATGHFLQGPRLDPEAPILVLGDLGVHGSEEERAAWGRTARRLRRGQVQLAALVPAPRPLWTAPRGAEPGERDPADPDSRSRRRARMLEWGAIPWERAGSPAAASPVDPRGLQARAERLLRLLSPAAFVQPGLLRELRRLLPATEADAATEVDVWRHADVRTADATGLVLHPEAAGRWRRRFAEEETTALQERVRDLLRAFHERLPRELLRIETLVWRSLVSPEVVAPPGDLSDALGFAARWEQSLLDQARSQRIPSTPRDAEASKTALAVRRAARAALLAMPPGAYDRVPELRGVWAFAFDGVNEVAVPGTWDPSELRARAGLLPEARWWGVRQVGGELVLSPIHGPRASDDGGTWDDGRSWDEPNGAPWPSRDRGPGSPVAWLLAADPHVYVQRGEGLSREQIVLEDGLCIPLAPGEGRVLSTDRCRVVLRPWHREAWTVAAGRDRFGLWADADVKGVRLRFRWLPPGRFLMGSPEGEPGRYDDEGPQRQVTWTAGRWLADVPVTQALWQAVMGEKPSRFRSPDRPVEQVSWDQCQGFLARLNDLVPGLDARLPSEAEWEHACRSGTRAATWLGDLEILGANNAPLLDGIAWYGGNCGVDFELENGVDLSAFPAKQHERAKGGTHPVRRRAPNQLGLFDMLGNVLEWCLDGVRSGAPYSPGDVVDPVPAAAGARRVIRGGSWLDQAGDVRAAYRDASLPGDRDGFLGFRVARGQVPGTRSVEPRSGASRSEASARAAERPRQAPRPPHPTAPVRGPRPPRKP